MDKLAYCGIEVSADELLVAVRRDQVTQPTRCFPNSASGHRALARYLKHPGYIVRVALESTGLYGLDVALLLHEQPHVEVMVANPRAVHHFAEAMMQRSKTDPLDALALLEFVERMRFQRWQPPSPAARALAAIARRLASIVEQCAAEKNRLHAVKTTATTPACIIRDLRRSIESLQKAHARLSAEARRLIAADAQLRQHYAHLLGICGFGETTSVQVLAELALLPPSLDVRQVVAHAGLDPRHHRSGTSVEKKPRISKRGNRHLRRALYMPAMVAARHNPHLRAFYTHLLERRKCKAVALTAVMRKLLHAIWGMLKHNQSFDGSKVYRLELAPSSAASSAAASCP